MAQNVKLTVKIGGNACSPVSYCSIRQRIDWHHSFELILPMDGFVSNTTTILTQAKEFIGKKVEIKFEIARASGNSIQNEFIGIVTDICLDRRNAGNKEIIVRGNSPTILMDGQASCRSYSDKTLNDIVSQIHRQISQNDLSIICNPAYTSEIPYIVQYKESSFHFLNRIADSFGEWCFYNGKELNFGRLKKSPKIDLPIDNTLSDFDLSLSIHNNNYKAITYNYLKSDTYVKSTKDYRVSDLDPFGDHALSRSEDVFKQENSFYMTGYYPNEQSLGTHVETQKMQRTKDLIVANGVSDNPGINVGSIINITGEGTNEDDFGEFIVVSINHNIDITANYVNHFTAIPAQANVPPVNRNIVAPISEVQPARIIDNDDPDARLGRVRAQFFWQDKDGKTPWIRVLQPYGGKKDSGEQHGFYFIPEIGDEVMVGFENDNPDKPFVIGSAYHKNTPPGHWHNADNNMKSIRTRNGNQIIFNDADGKEEIRILNNDDASPTNEISLSMNNSGKITIKTEGELEISAQSIKISSKNDITIDAGQKTKFTSSDYQLDATNSINLSGQQLDIEGTNTSLKGQAKLKLEGAQTKIEATTLSVEGSAQAEFKGTVVTIDGTTITEVKGVLVKIN